MEQLELQRQEIVKQENGGFGLGTIATITAGVLGSAAMAYAFYKTKWNLMKFVCLFAILVAIVRIE